ncbi:MAG: hypothetical protein WDW38_003729 [Sanguina aurantia]
MRIKKHTSPLSSTARYSASIVLGVFAVHWSKRLLKAIPVVGFVISPLLDLLPTLLVGPALGAAVVLVVQEGDVAAAQRKVRRTVEEGERHARAYVQEVAGELKDVAKTSRGMQRDILTAVEEGSREAERSLNLPEIRRETRRLIDGLDAQDRR